MFFCYSDFLRKYKEDLVADSQESNRCSDLLKKAYVVDQLESLAIAKEKAISPETFYISQEGCLLVERLLEQESSKVVAFVDNFFENSGTSSFGLLQYSADDFFDQIMASGFIYQGELKQTGINSTNNIPSTIPMSLKMISDFEVVSG